MEAAKGKDFTVFDHIGSECLYDTIALAKHAVVYINPNIIYLGSRSKGPCINTTHIL